MIVSFDARSLAPGAYESASLRDWVVQWRCIDPDRIVVIGCSACGGGSAAAVRRAARLMALRQILLDTGVAADHVRFGDAPLRAKGPPMALAATRAADGTEVAWLRAVDGAPAPARAATAGATPDNGTSTAMGPGPAR
jgi:acetyl esterase/lipase